MPGIVLNYSHVLSLLNLLLNLEMGTIIIVILRMRKLRHQMTLVDFHSWRRKWHPTPVFLPGKSHGRRSLVGYSPWGCKELDTTERLHFHSRSLTGGAVFFKMKTNHLLHTFPTHESSIIASVLQISENLAQIKIIILFWTLYLYWRKRSDIKVWAPM